MVAKMPPRHNIMHTVTFFDIWSYQCIFSHVFAFEIFYIHCSEKLDKADYPFSYLLNPFGGGGVYKFFYPKFHIFAYLICKLLINHTIYHYQVILCRFEKLFQGEASHRKN